MNRRVRVTRLLAGATAAAALAAPWWAPHTLRRLEVFRIERVEVSGVRLLAPHEVLAASGITAGDNVWDEPHDWLAALRAHPAVHDVSIERALPGTLRIRVLERQPVAFVEIGALRAVTGDGQVLPVDPARAALDLPLVRSSARLGEASRIEDAETRSLLAEATWLSQLAPALMIRVSELRRTPAGDVALRMVHPAAELLLPPMPGPDRLRQVRAVLDDLERQGAAALHVDGRFADQVVVRFPSSS